MESLYFNTQGDGISAHNTNSPSLCITWAKAFDEIYCHHAVLSVPTSFDTLFLPDVANISVRIRQNMIEKGVVKSFSDRSISRFLPFTYVNNALLIPLNSAEVLDALCENGWTTLKGGRRGAPKSFPLSISITCDNRLLSEVFFNIENGKFPFTICENALSNLKDSEKLETTIIF